MKIVLRRLGIVLLFLIVAIIIVNRAPEYDLEYKYQDGDIRVIFNDVEITRDIQKLPQVAMLMEGEIMLSQDTVDILFDKNLYYEEKYETLITTTQEHRANLKLNSKVIEIDHKTENMNVPPVEITYSYREDNRYEGKEKAIKDEKEKVIYIPIKSLEKVYNMEIEFKDKIIITENQKNRVRVYVDENDHFELKHTKDSLAKNVEVIGPGSYVDFYDYDATKEFLYARSESGELGYIAREKLKNYNVSPATTEEEVKNPEKLNIAWDYIHPDATSIGNKANREKAEPIDVVVPTLLYLKNTKGNIQYRSNVVSSYLEWAKKVGYRVWVTFKNDDFSISETSTFLNDMNHRETAIQSLIQFAKDYEIEGINVDIEWIYQKDATVFSQFIRELCVEAKQNDILISVCVNVPDGSADWSLCYQHKALSEYADYLAVMTYDQYGASSKVAGPNASLEWVTNNMEKLVNRDGVKSQKILLGIPLYSRLWTSSNNVVKSKTLTMAGAKEYLNKSGEVIWVEEAGQYYYENSAGTARLWIEENESIAKKLELVAQYDLAGSAYWMLGYETNDIWNTVSENLKF